MGREPKRAPPCMSMSAILLVALSQLMPFMGISMSADVSGQMGPAEHDPIRIDDTRDLTHKNGVTGGKGTSRDPYVIGGWYVNTTEGDGIVISDLTCHLVIWGCYIRSDPFGNHIGILLVNCTNVTVKDCGIYLNRIGLDMKNCTGNRIIGCMVKGNQVGVRLEGDQNTLEGLDTSRNGETGIHLINSSRNLIVNCRSSHHNSQLRSSSGLVMQGSDLNLVKNCTFEMNYGDGIRIEGGSGVIGSNSIRNCTIRNNIDGIYIGSSGSNGVTECSFSSNERGLFIGRSSECFIENSSFYRNEAGLHIYNSSKIGVVDCIFESNGYGVLLISCMCCYMTGTWIMNSSDIGISVDRWGGCDPPSSGNTVWGNHLLFNRVQARDLGVGNSWDDGQRGNYWSHHYGPDNDSDGKVDLPLPIIGSDSFDMFPISFSPPERDDVLPVTDEEFDPKNTRETEDVSGEMIVLFSAVAVTTSVLFLFVLLSKRERGGSTR